ncbi:MAG: metallophosphoesterase [Bacteroidales bacterium]
MSRTMTFIIFFSIILLIYGSINYYVFSRGLQLIKLYPVLKSWYISVFILLAASYVVARFLERVYLSVFTDILTWIGAFWLSALMYFLFAVLVIDIIRLLVWLIPGISIKSLTLLPNFKESLGILILVTVFILLSIGYINATRPKVTTLSLKIPPKQAMKKHLKIAMASDIHLGTLVANRRLDRLIKTINDNKPDIILLAGDIVDEDLAPVIRQNLGQRLEELKAPLGIFAITGNHEYIGGAEAAVDYLEHHGIRFLRDTVQKIEGVCWLAGREDRDRSRFAGKKRKELTEIIKLTDNTLPIILMDHQPFNLDSAALAGVDLQLSGHTHNGQQWPFNHLTKAIYEVSYGYVKKGNTHFYVSSGFGTWGPPVRLGSRSEVVLINLSLED